MDRDKNALTEKIPVTRFVNWPAAALPESTVTASFEGLFAFCYNPQRECEIGVHQADGRHKLKIRIFENEAPLPVTLPAEIKVVSLGIRIAGNEKPANVYFFKGGGARDFRWVIDLENEEFYPEVFEKKAVFKAILRVRHGVFFTKKRTKFLLDRVLALPIGFLNRSTLSHPADDIAVNIELAANEYVSLVINGSEVIQLPRTAGKRYEVRFTNQCHKNDEEYCEFDFDDLLESNRNDFHFHRDALSLPLLTPRYGLVLGRGQGRRPPLSDEAPCMGAGFGGTGGFPPPQG